MKMNHRLTLIRFLLEFLIKMGYKTQISGTQASIRTL